MQYQYAKVYQWKNELEKITNSWSIFWNIPSSNANNRILFNIWISAIIIGIVTFAISIIGVKIGNEFGDRYERRAETVGGFILIFMGVKILLEHLEIL